MLGVFLSAAGRGFIMRHHSSRGIFAIAFGLLAVATTAQAGNESWVSATGTNTGTCPITAPCRTFQFAHDQTNNNGAINVLTSGNYGPLTISKPISIVADGVEAVINSGANGAGIIVQAGANAIVSLRGLSIDLRGTANTGINFVSGAALHVQNCVIRRSVDGIRFVPASGTSELYVADSVVAGANNYGIEVSPTGSGGATAVLERVRVEKASSIGIAFFSNNTTGSITATVRDSVAAGSGGNSGISAFGGGGGTTNVMIDRSASVNNSTGIGAGGAGTTVRIGDSTVSGNAVGLGIGSGGVIASYGTNKVNGNTVDGVTPTPVAMK